MTHLIVKKSSQLTDINIVMKTMLKISAFILGLGFIACTGPIKQTCDSYCLTEGGTCDFVEQGKSEYNTDTGAVKKNPTVFHCKFFN